MNATKMRRFIGAACCGCWLLLAARAQPSGPLWEPRGPNAWFVPVGINLGAAVHPHRPNGFLLGGEVSAAYFDEDFAWYGGYVDASRDFGPDVWRISAGPEVGFAIFGIDLGYLAELGEDHTSHGFQLRGLVTFLFASAYVRWVHLAGDSPESNLGELGILLKYPIGFPEGI